MDFIRRIGTTKHKYKLQLFFEKLTSRKTIQGQVYITVNRGNQKQSMATIYSFGEDKVCHFKRDVLTFEAITLFYEEGDKKYQEKPGDIKVVFIDKNSEKRLLGEVQFDVAHYADVGRESQDYNQPLVNAPEKYDLKLSFKVFIKYIGEGSERSASVSQNQPKREQSLDKKISGFFNNIFSPSEAKSDNASQGQSAEAQQSQTQNTPAKIKKSVRIEEDKVHFKANPSQQPTNGPQPSIKHKQEETQKPSKKKHIKNEEASQAEKVILNQSGKDEQSRRKTGQQKNQRTTRRPIQSEDQTYNSQKGTQEQPSQRKGNNKRLKVQDAVQTDIDTYSRRRRIDPPSRAESPAEEPVEPPPRVQKDAKTLKPKNIQQNQIPINMTDSTITKEDQIEPKASIDSGTFYFDDPPPKIKQIVPQRLPQNPSSLKASQMVKKQKEIEFQKISDVPTNQREVEETDKSSKKALQDKLKKAEEQIKELEEKTESFKRVNAALEEELREKTSMKSKNTSNSHELELRLSRCERERNEALVALENCKKNHQKQLNQWKQKCDTTSEELGLTQEYAKAEEARFKRELAVKKNEADDQLKKYQLRTQDLDAAKEDASSAKASLKILRTQFSQFKLKISDRMNSAYQSGNMAVIEALMELLQN